MKRKERDNTDILVSVASPYIISRTIKFDYHRTSVSRIYHRKCSDEETAFQGSCRLFAKTEQPPSSD